MIPTLLNKRNGNISKLGLRRSDKFNKIIFILTSLRINIQDTSSFLKVSVNNDVICKTHYMEKKEVYEQ